MQVLNDFLLFNLKLYVCWAHSATGKNCSNWLNTIHDDILENLYFNCFCHELNFFIADQ